MKIHWPCGQQG